MSQTSQYRGFTIVSGTYSNDEYVTYWIEKRPGQDRTSASDDDGPFLTRASAERAVDDIIRIVSTHRVPTAS